MFLIKKNPQSIDITDLETDKYACAMHLTIVEHGITGAIIGEGERRIKAYLADFLKTSEERGIKPEVFFKFDRKTNVLTCTNGSKLRFISTKNLNSLRGLELKFALVNDWGPLSQNDMDLINSRIR